MDRQVFAPSEREYDLLGEIELAPEVIEVIANIATEEIDGVDSLQGNFSSDVKSLFGKSNYNFGVQLSTDEDGLSVDIFCDVKYGENVPQVALEIQQAVREQVFHMTEIELAEVNVHVVSIVPSKNKKSSLFELNDDKDE